jgi:hypothetical protein
MKKFKSEDLLNSLTNDVRQAIAAVELMKGMDKIKLAYPQAEGKWTAVQALEHLNMYNRYYLPAIEKAIAVKTGERTAWFNSGRMGEYFVKSMIPTNVYEVKNKMKAMKNYHPALGLNVDTVMNEFLEHQHKLLQLLELAKDRNLNSIRIPISISRLIRLKLGDTFRFLVAHEQRHLIQARNAIHGLGIATDKFPVLISAAPAHA